MTVCCLRARPSLDRAQTVVFSEDPDTGRQRTADETDMFSSEVDRDVLDRPLPCSDYVRIVSGLSDRPLSKEFVPSISGYHLWITVLSSLFDRPRTACSTPGNGQSRLSLERGIVYFI